MNEEMTTHDQDQMRAAAAAGFMAIVATWGMMSAVTTATVALYAHAQDLNWGFWDVARGSTVASGLLLTLFLIATPRMRRARP